MTKDGIKFFLGIISLFGLMFTALLLLPLGYYALSMIGALVFGTTFVYVLLNENSNARKRRNLDSRVRYRMKHCDLELFSFSTVSIFDFTKTHELYELFDINRSRSYNRYTIRASLNEHTFVYNENIIYVKHKLEPHFKGIVITIPSKVIEVSRIDTESPELRKYFDGYVVLKPGTVRLYITSELYIHEMYKGKDLKEQTSKIINDVRKAFRIVNNIEQVYIESRGGVQ